jgi:hypothetical protein
MNLFTIKMEMHSKVGAGTSANVSLFHIPPHPTAWYKLSKHWYITILLSFFCITCMQPSQTNIISVLNVLNA